MMEVLEMLAYIATVLGIPIAILLFVNEKRKERRDREYGTYDALGKEYVDYLRLCMENPELDLYDIPLEIESELSAEQKIRQYAMFEILVSLLERAYLMYQDQSTDIKKSQWSGWDDYMHDYARRETFRRLWQTQGVEYDLDFIKYVTTVIEKVQAETVVSADAVTPVQ
ncbi:MAG: hypothetical protein IPM39_15005 [Chloroflexi bacterium]|nr:hypothetical protein [Chloroflexota bacterium]